MGLELGQWEQTQGTEGQRLPEHGLVTAQQGASSPTLKSGFGYTEQISQEGISTWASIYWWKNLVSCKPLSWSPGSAPPCNRFLRIYLGYSYLIIPHYPPALPLKTT